MRPRGFRTTFPTAEVQEKSEEKIMENHELFLMLKLANPKQIE